MITIAADQRKSVLHNNVINPIENSLLFKILKIIKRRNLSKPQWTRQKAYVEQLFDYPSAVRKSFQVDLLAGIGIRKKMVGSLLPLTTLTAKFLFTQSALHYQFPSVLNFY